MVRFSGSLFQEYLGDGLYVSFDGEFIWLETSDGVSITNRVAMERFVLEAFQRWLVETEEKKG